LINLILSLDYEIFGNGAGDVMRDIIEPTNRLLHICERHGAKLTIMFEVAEYWAFKQNEDKLGLDYSPAQVMAEQIQNAISRGHDVQLHLHPQWIGAELDDHIWRVKINQWCIADLPHGLGDDGDEYSIMGALSKGKKTLESLLCPIALAYECIAFRAGGFHIQPSRRVIAAMKAIGLAMDSSVVQGLYVQSPWWQSDFRDAVSNYGYWWTTADDVCRSGPEYEQILELPIYSKMQPYLTNLRWSKLRAELKRRKLESCYPSTIKQARGLRSTYKITYVLQKLTSMHPITVDFCKLNAQTMSKAIEDVILTNGHSDDETKRTIPVVLIGHSKDFWNDEHLDSFLSTMRSFSVHKGVIKFSTFSDVAQKLNRPPETSAFDLKADGTVSTASKSIEI
jgi:hypothetical protein